MNTRNKKNPNLREKLKKVPDSPGVYIFKNRNKNIIYVGKTISLKSRLSSYFTTAKDVKTSRLQEDIFDFDVVPVSSEGEALVLEAFLIKKELPPFNISYKDDKSYPYVKITKEKFPTIRVVREEKKKNAEYFGPFTDVRGLKKILWFVRRFYHFRSCLRDVEHKISVPCTFYYIKKCVAPCTGKVKSGKYREIIEGVRKFFSGEYRKYTKRLKKEMDSSIKKWDFEEAKVISERITLLERMETRIPWRKEEELIEYHKANVLPNLADILKLDKIPVTIEGYDISNLGGNLATGSKIVFTGGIPVKGKYRRFKIKTVEGIDDYLMLKEVLKRRFDNIGKKDMPDLLLIDGGKGHLMSAVDILKEIKIRVPVISIAKKEEIIWTENDRAPIILSKDSPELHLIQNIRDEAHRFALAYHLNLRKKQITHSSIEDMPGIGEKRKKIIIDILTKFPGRFPEEELIKAKIPQSVINTLDKNYFYRTC
ncbi:MAG: excinuclease ABC subunit UvrC [Candidatus Omnitrophica bacterium]|nr:excinuclease ABC subunit UvrC [Candidatus Omnitrophota bacterium]